VDDVIVPSVSLSLMSQYFSTETCAVIVADKYQFGRDRVPHKAATLAALEEDRHILVNLLYERTQPELTDNGKTFRLRLVYNPIIKSHEPYQWASMDSERAEYAGHKRVRLNSNTYQRFIDHQVPYSVSVEREWGRIYTERLTILVSAALALFPALETFSLEIIDYDIPFDLHPEYYALRKRVHTFSRNSLDEDFHTYAAYLRKIDTLSYT